MKSAVWLPVQAGEIYEGMANAKNKRATNLVARCINGISIALLNKRVAYFNKYLSPTSSPAVMLWVEARPAALLSFSSALVKS